MTLQAWLDALPRTHVGVAAGRPRSAFLACGVTGFHLAVVTALAGALLAGRSLLVTAMLCAVCGASFFGWAFARRWVTGREQLVVLEHAWFAGACCVLTLRALGEPVLPYLDVVAVAICVFVAAGRVGCTLVGCCHGRPSLVGVAYGEAAVQDGFPAALVGVRLFPVALIEGASVALIGVAGLLTLPWATAGVPLAWCLASYAVLRFGLEALRGDERPHWLGLSQARWMSLAQLAAALAIADGARPVGVSSPAAAWLALGIKLAGALAFRYRRRAPGAVSEPDRITGVAGVSGSNGSERTTLDPEDPVNPVHPVRLVHRAPPNTPPDAARALRVYAAALRTRDAMTTR